MDVDELRSIRNYWQKQIRLLDAQIAELAKNPKHPSLEEFLVRAYIRLGRVDLTAQDLNDAGYKTAGVKGPRKFKPDDIGQIIKLPLENVHPALLELARDLFEYQNIDWQD